MKRKTAALFLGLGALCTTLAAPLTTVPWNGYKGAVSFTFDDGCKSQLENVVPALKERGIVATFFVTSSALSGNLEDWTKVAQDGNELGNHTLSHKDLSSFKDSASVSAEVLPTAEALRAISGVQGLTLAYPYCNTNTLASAATNEQNIIARTCGGSALFDWSTRPDWMAMTSYIISDSASAAGALVNLDKAANAGKWFVTLNHGVGGDWMSVETKAVLAMFDRAIADSLWIATYQDAAAYWRAGEVMDTVQAVSTAEGWKLSWQSPHPRMPRSVQLRVRPDAAMFGSSFHLVQKGNALQAQEDGTYLVEFMDLELEVHPGAASSLLGYQAKPVLRPGAARLYSLDGKVYKER